jgi:uncharacterized protein (DUF58 family)
VLEQLFTSQRVDLPQDETKALAIVEMVHTLLTHVKRGILRHPVGLPLVLLPSQQLVFQDQQLVVSPSIHPLFQLMKSMDFLKPHHLNHSSNILLVEDGVSYSLRVMEVKVI